METLRGVFPAVPTEALLRVLEVCDQSVAVASTWLLENDWQELMDDEEDEVEVTTANSNVTGVTSTVTTDPDAATGNQELETRRISTPGSAASATAAQQARTMVLSTEINVTGNNGRGQNVTGPYFARHSNVGYQFQEEFDSEEDEEVGENEEDEDEDEDEEDMYYDGGFGVRGVPPLTKRVKITKSKEKAQADDFWIAFDGQVVIKNMIELLNTSLSKLAHSKVVLLNQPAKDLDETAAAVKLRSILASEEAIGDEAVDENLKSPRDASNRITLASLLNGSPSAAKDIGKTSTTATRDAPVNLKRKRNEEATVGDSPRQGFFAHFFPVRELDMVWRTVMHAHLFKGRFGEKIEFHTASGGSFSERDFDELMHIQTSAASSRAASLGFSPLSTLKCCLILPCSTDEEEIFRIGRNIHSMLKVQGSLYYQVVGVPSGKRPTTLSTRKANITGSPRNDHIMDLLGDDGTLTEERFRQFARYRVKEEEKEATIEEAKPTNVGMDPYMSYQQPRKIVYCLQMLDISRWASRLTD